MIEKPDQTEKPSHPQTSLSHLNQHLNIPAMQGLPGMTQGHKRLRDWEIDYLQNNIGGVKREMQMIAGAMNPMNYPPEMFGQPNAKRRRQQGFCLNVSDLPEHVFLQKKIQLQIWVK